jgi:hypothetical protein
MPAFADFSCHTQTAENTRTSPINAITAAATGGMTFSFDGDTRLYAGRRGTDAALTPYSDQLASSQAVALATGVDWRSPTPR